jgi:hypothetical protein
MQPQCSGTNALQQMGAAQMRNLFLSVTLTAIMTAPVQAADWRGQAVDVRPGAFVGARMQLSLGGKLKARPRAALTIAPTQSRISSSGMVRTSIGEGVALNFGPNSKPRLTLLGVKPAVALGLQGQDEVGGDQKLGMSAGGWVAIGVGAALLAGAAAFYVVKSNECTECDD